MSDPAEEARLRRLRLLRRGMENMGSWMPARSDAPVAEVPEGSPLSVLRPALETAAPADPAEAELIARIEQRFRQLGETHTYFEVLGLQRDANKEAIKAAFLGLVKQFHPDRLPQSLNHLSGKLSAVFEQLKEAQETLTDEIRRAVYLHGLDEADRKARAFAEGGGPAQAVELFRQAELALRRREFPAAEGLYQRAYELDPKSHYLAGQGWSIYLDTTRKADAERAKGLIATALKSDPKCDRAAYQLGVIAKMEGDVEQAERFFKEAVRLNDKHVEASQELRLLELRRGKR